MPGDLKPPIFLLGNVRSGTSMMHDLFDLHPEVKSWYEPRTIWTYADPGRRHDRFDETDATPRVVAYIRKRFLRYQQQHGDLRVMEKTPSNLLRIPYVKAIFPEAKYLYLVREPLANISSSELMWSTPIHRHKVWRRLKETPKTQLHYYAARYVVDHARIKILRKRYLSVWGVRYPGIYRDIKRMRVEEVIAKQWVACIRQAREDLASFAPGTVLEMRYEDFVTSPVEQFERILHHFDLEMTPEIDRTLRERIDPNRRQKWKRLDPEVIAAVIPILQEEMNHFGYEIPEDLDPDGGKDWAGRASAFPLSIDAHTRGLEGETVQEPIELILVKQWASYIAVPMFIVDMSGNLIYFNDSAEVILGRSFDQAGEIHADDLEGLFDTQDIDGSPLANHELPLVRSLVEQVPAHRALRMRGLDGSWRVIDVTAIPIIGQGDRHLGALAAFWEVG